MPKAPRWMTVLSIAVLLTLMVTDCKKADKTTGNGSGTAGSEPVDHEAEFHKLWHVWNSSLPAPPNFSQLTTNERSHAEFEYEKKLVPAQREWFGRERLIREGKKIGLSLRWRCYVHDIRGLNVDCSFRPEGPPRYRLLFGDDCGDPTKVKKGMLLHPDMLAEGNGWTFGGAGFLGPRFWVQKNVEQLDSVEYPAARGILWVAGCKPPPEVLAKRRWCEHHPKECANRRWCEEQRASIKSLSSYRNKSEAPQSEWLARCKDDPEYKIVSDHFVGPYVKAGANATSPTPDDAGRAGQGPDIEKRTAGSITPESIEEAVKKLLDDSVPPAQAAALAVQSFRRSGKRSQRPLASAANTRGFRLYKADKLDDALPLFQAAASIDPTYGMPRYNAARVYAMKGDVKNCVRFLKELRRMPGQKKRLSEARTSEGFKKVWDDPSFKAIFE